MKKILITLQVLGVVAMALSLVVCAPPSAGTSITDPVYVSGITPEMLPPSLASNTTFTTNQNVIDFITNTGEEVVNSIQYDSPPFGPVTGNSQFMVAFNDVIDWDNNKLLLDSNTIAVIDDLIAQAENFQITGVIDFATMLSGKDYGDYITVHKAVCDAKINASPIPDPTLMSFNVSGQLEVSLKHPVPLNGQPDIVQGARFHLNFGAIVTVRIVYVWNPDIGVELPETQSVSYDYYADLQVGCSMKNAAGTNGGKFIAKTFAKNAGTITDFTTALTPADFGDTGPISCTIYNDANEAQYTIEYTSLTALLTELGAL